MGIGKNPRSRRAKKPIRDEVAERWLRGEGWGLNGQLQWDPDDPSAPAEIRTASIDEVGAGIKSINEAREQNSRLSPYHAIGWLEASERKASELDSLEQKLSATKRDFEHFERNLKQASSQRTRDPFLPNCPTGTSGSEYDDGNSVRYQTGRGISYDPVSASSRKHQSWFEAKKQMELALDDHPVVERGLQRRLR